MTEQNVEMVYQKYQTEIPQDVVTNTVFQDMLAEAKDEMVEDLMAQPIKEIKKVKIYSIGLGIVGLGRFFLGDKDMGIKKCALTAVTLVLYALAIWLLFVPDFVVLSYVLFVVAGALTAIGIAWHVLDVFATLKQARQSNYEALTVYLINNK